MLGGKVGSVDDSAAKKIPGVRQIVVLDDLRRRRRRPYVGGQARARRAENDWDEGPNAKINSTDIWNDLRAASEKDGVVAKSKATSPRACRTGEKLRCRLRAAVPGPCADGADELHRSRLTPDACEIWTGTQIASGCSRICGQGRGSAGREGDRQQPPTSAAASAAGSSRTWSARRCASPKQVRLPDQGRVDARRRHAARCLPAGLSRHDFGFLVERQDRRLEIQGRRARPCSRVGCRRRSRTASTATLSIARSTCPTTSRTCTSNMCAPNRRR